ncbi:MAG: hypothetical protein KAI53_01760 [Candidatus Aenigmarchaeota archaeon]|nr:hypothetical protein [Candidatus Aenigmarchaeota archaeon]
MGDVYFTKQEAINNGEVWDEQHNPVPEQVNVCGGVTIVPGEDRADTQQRLYNTIRAEASNRVDGFNNDALFTGNNTTYFGVISVEKEEYGSLLTSARNITLKGINYVLLKLSRDEIPPMNQKATAEGAVMVYLQA